MMGIVGFDRDFIIYICNIDVYVYIYISQPVTLVLKVDRARVIVEIVCFLVIMVIPICGIRN